MLRCIPCSEEDEVTAFKKSFVVTHFHTARLTSPKPQNMFCNHLFITVTVSLEVPLCQAIIYPPVIYPPVISPPPCSYEGVPGPPLSEERQPHLPILLLPAMR